MAPLAADFPKNGNTALATGKTAVNKPCPDCFFFHILPPISTCYCNHFILCYYSIVFIR